MWAGDYCMLLHRNLYNVFAGRVGDDGAIDLGAIEFPDLDAVEEQVAQSCVYPNPGRDVFQVLTDWEDAFVVVYDLNGRKMCEQQVNGNSTNIVTESWPSGMYFWKIVSTDSTTFVETGKWIKE